MLILVGHVSFANYQKAGPKLLLRVVPVVCVFVVEGQAVDAQEGCPAEDARKMPVGQVVDDHHQHQGEGCLREASKGLLANLQRFSTSAMLLQVV